ncbi:hypothetical protein HOL21_01275 [Candidatus Woesearchaeota archaeon]|jgi:hypothetical protein|nr:hypothetical protein [Candidatus Woesearchaeota archaeon]MBT5396824.1 hypothetical protein [Candidatus Woesearchaeota archaeon]MBT5924640.1 hypothetical protein [Candidatus Woesearchaeota archaeon]MBT6367712.1 hypothetical protein [Candidatus Woesearchaeota archaeon]MBT7762887.1 hypothetical protein [Candidatus Woesearchaeota archaeon]
MEKNITFRTVIEILGKPQEHVEKSIKEYVKKLKDDDKYEVLEEEFADIKKQEDQDLWATFAELEVKTSSLQDLSAFCFEYMPSLMEIIEPKKMNLTDSNVSEFLSDLQSKLHQIDMVAKHVKMENDMLKKSINSLLKNYIVVLLRPRNLTADQLSKLTGVAQDKLEDFLDQLIDEGRIDLKEGIYFLTDTKK